jgi:hypothetical protein
MRSPISKMSKSKPAGRQAGIQGKPKTQVSNLFESLLFEITLNPLILEFLKCQNPL